MNDPVRLIAGAHNSSMKIAREGYPFVIVAGGLAIITAASGWNMMALIPGLAALGFAWFFRDPERIAPKERGLIIAPADGKVVSVVSGISGPLMEGLGTRVSIFMSPLDVHINRMPVEGTIEESRHQSGRFLAAYKDEAVEQNEQNALRIVDGDGRRIGVVQVAGLLARRIVCNVRKGDALDRGERYGLIMFGSRTDLYLPKGSQIEVAEGQQVKGGETIIGRFV